MLEELKHRIHSFRLPIRNRRVLFLVKTCYFLAPIALGGALMQWVTPEKHNRGPHTRRSSAALLRRVRRLRDAATPLATGRLRAALRRDSARVATATAELAERQTPFAALAPEV